MNNQNYENRGYGNGNQYQNQRNNQNQNDRGGQYQKNNNGQNNNAESKIYLGNGFEKERSNGDKFISASLCFDDIMNKIPDEHLKMAKNGKRYFKICINPYRDGANEYGNTHSIQLDTYKPEMDNQAFKK
jgi:hypothetical protein